MRSTLISWATFGFAVVVLGDAKPNMQYDPKTISTCTWWYDNYEGKTCEAIRDWRYGISAADFSRWNPSVRSDCTNWQPLSYCVEVASETKSSSVAPTSTTPVSTKAAATPTPSPVLTGWNALGCYVDSNTLSNKTTKAGGTSLTVNKCEAACFGDSYKYAGVKVGTECWCGAYVGNSWTSNQADCNVACAGNSSQTCGGKSVFNVFEAQTKITLPPAGSQTPWPTASTPLISATSATSHTPAASAQPTWQAVGCYKDLYPSTNRTLKTLSSASDTAQTPQSCQTACLKAGTLYAGLENGRECWCGNEIQSPTNNTPVAESDCNKPCTGDKSLQCGAVARAYLYKYVVPSVPWIGLGCYGESNPRILRNIISVVGGQANNTRQNCITGCDNLGYSYAGVENAGECWCDNQITGTLATDGTASCNKACPGKKDETCGGLSRLDVFVKSSLLG